MGALYLITGNEEFSVKERANDLVRELCGESPEDNPDLEIIRGDVENEKFFVPLDKLLDSIETPSFLSPQKFIWLKHFPKFDEAFAESSTKKKRSRLDLLSDFLKQTFPPDLTLVIDAAGLDRRKAFYKLCEKVCESSGGKLEWFEKTDLRAKGAAAILIRRIKEQALNAGKRMEDAAAAYIAETTGADPAALRGEVDKLIAYAGDGKVISLDDCYQICSRSADTLSWEFSSALAERNPARALELIPGILETMEQERGSASRPEMAIVAAAHSEFKRLLSIKCEGERFHIPRGASADFFYSLFDQEKGKSESPLFSLHPFRAFKTWENAVRFSEADMARAFRALLHANTAMVTGANPRLALEALVTDITGNLGERP